MSGTTYRVRSELNLRSNAADVVNRVARALGTLDLRIRTTEQAANALMQRLAGLGTGRVTQGARSAERALDSLRQSTTSTAQAMGRLRPGISATTTALGGLGQAAGGASSAVSGMTRSISGQSRALTRNASAAQQAATAMRQLAAVPPPANLPVMRGGLGRGGGYGRHHRVGVVGEAYGSEIVAHEGRRLFGEVFGAAFDVQHEEALLRAALGSQHAGAFPDMRKRAEDITRLVPGTTLAENLKAISELIQVFGDPQEAAHFAQGGQRLSRVLGLVTGRDPGDAAFLAYRAMEMRGDFMNNGHFDPAQAAEREQMMTRAIVATRGRVDPQQFLNFVQQGRTAARLLSPEAMYEWMPSLIAAMGGQRAGTALTALTRQLGPSGGTMTRERARMFHDIGVLGNYRAGKGMGGMVTWNRNQLTRGDLLSSNPLQWLNEVLIPALANKGIKGQAAQMDWLRRAFQTGPGQGLSTEVLQQILQVLKDAQLTRNADVNAVLNSPRQKLSELQAAATNFAAAVGEAGSPMAVAALVRLTGALNGMTDWTKANPEATRALLGLGVGLTGLATAAAAFSIGRLAAVGIGEAAVGLTRLGVALVGPGLAAGVLLGVAMGIDQIGKAIGGHDWEAGKERFLHAMQGVWEGLTQGFWRLMRGGGDDLATSRFRPDASDSMIYEPFGLLPMTPPEGGQPRGPLFQAPTPPNSPVPGPGGGSLPGLTTPQLGGGRDGLRVNPYLRLQNFSPVPPQGQGGVVPIILQLDGREVGRGVMPWLGREASGPLTGAARFDGLRAMPSAEGVSVCLQKAAGGSFCPPDPCLAGPRPGQPDHNAPDLAEPDLTRPHYAPAYISEPKHVSPKRASR